MARAKRSRPEPDIPLIHPDAAAVNIGARMHVAAVPPDRAPEPVRSFGTCTGDLRRLADWFQRCGVRTVAMESTGVYWIPAYEVFDAPTIGAAAEVWAAIERAAGAAVADDPTVREHVLGKLLRRLGNPQATPDPAPS